jgi:hypothetical protein
MEQGGETPTGWVLVDDIRATLQEVEPGTPAEVALYAEGLDQIEELADARRTRLVAAHEGIPAVLWVVLVFAAVAVVGFTYLFGLENTWAHRLMVMAVAGVIGLVLFTIGAMEHPFSGGARIGTDAFEQDTGEVRDEQAERPPIGSVPILYSRERVKGCSKVRLQERAYPCLHGEDGPRDISLPAF